MNIIINSLLDKYVLFNGIYNREEVILTKHLFYVYDVIDDPKDKFKYALQSIKVKRFEIWARIDQIVLLEEEDQIIARTLYGKRQN